LEKLQQHPPGTTGVSSQDPFEIIRELMNTTVSSYASAWPYFAIGLIPVTYLMVNWQFAVPLIVDRKIGFWSAMTTSWKIVHKHWFQLFGLVLVTSVLSSLGWFVCCVGVLITAPLGILAICYAYEDIFGRKTT
jgi:uncharacterized membrane protein